MKLSNGHFAVDLDVQSPGQRASEAGIRQLALTGYILRKSQLQLSADLYM